MRKGFGKKPCRRILMSFLVSLLGKKLINFYVKQPAMVRSEMFITAISFMGTKRDDANTDVVKQSKLLHQIDRVFYPHVSSLLDFNFTKPEIIPVSDTLSLRHISGKRTNKNSSKKIAILYIHGGAFVMNMNTLYDPYFNFLNLLTTLPVNIHFFYFLPFSYIFRYFSNSIRVFINQVFIFFFFWKNWELGGKIGLWS